VLLERDIELGLAEVFLDGVRGGEGGIMVLEGATTVAALDRGLETMERSTIEHGGGQGVSLTP
jgi:hypothetical protein